MASQTEIRIEDNKPYPKHVGAFKMKLLTAGEEISAGLRMVQLAGGMDVGNLPVQTGNLIFTIAHLEQCILEGPDWLFEEQGGKRVIRNLLEFEDQGVLDRLLVEWAKWRSLLLVPRVDTGGSR